MSTTPPRRPVVLLFRAPAARSLRRSLVSVQARPTPRQLPADLTMTTVQLIDRLVDCHTLLARLLNDAVAVVSDVTVVLRRHRRPRPARLKTRRRK